MARAVASKHLIAVDRRRGAEWAQW
jgi:hypothetical protein